MFDCRQELDRRIDQFASNLKKMDHRAHEEVGGPCFIIFEERKPSNKNGEHVDGYAPFRKVYIYGDETSAAEDMAYIFFRFGSSRWTGGSM